MLKAIAREVGHAADAVSDAAGAAVSAVLPGKGSNDAEKTDNAPAGMEEDVEDAQKGNDQDQDLQQGQESKVEHAKVTKCVCCAAMQPAFAVWC
jgi:hypothetical protein